jgi:hypothetical protein
MNLPFAPTNRPETQQQLKTQLQNYERLRMDITSGKYPQATENQIKEINNTINRLEIENRELELKQTKKTLHGKMKALETSGKKISAQEENDIQKLLQRTQELEHSLQIRKSYSTFKPASIPKKKGGTRKKKQNRKKKTLKGKSNKKR